MLRTHLTVGLGLYRVQGTTGYAEGVDDTSHLVLHIGAHGALVIQLPFVYLNNMFGDTYIVQCRLYLYGSDVFYVLYPRIT